MPIRTVRSIMKKMGRLYILMLSDEYKRTLIDHDKTIESYKKNLNLLKSEKEHYIDQYQKLSQWAQNELIEREKQLKQVTDELAKTTQQNSQQSPQLPSLEVLSDTTSQLSATKKQLTEANNQLIATKNKLIEAGNQYQQLQNTYQQCRVRNDDVEKRLEQMTELEKKLKDVSQSNAELRSKIETLQKDLSLSKTNESKYQNEIVTKNEELRLFKVNWEALNRDYEIIKNDFAKPGFQIDFQIGI